jgi:hypothetical protein
MRSGAALVLAAAMVVTVTFPLVADVYLKQKHHIDPYTLAGQRYAASEGITTIWFAKDRARVEQNADTTIIIRLDKKSMTVVYHTSKTYREQPLESVQSVIDKAMETEEMTPEAKAQAQAMMQRMAAMMKPTFTVQETQETKKIGKWNCRKYLLTVSIAEVKSTSEVWATADVKVDYAFYNTLMNVYLAKMPSMEDTMKEMEKIKGFMVLTNSSSQVGGATMKTSIELIEIDDASKPPAGGYEVPAGYKKVSK